MRRSKITLSLSLFALALIAAAGGASAAPNTGQKPKSTTPPAQTCQTITAPKWDCKNGDKPGKLNNSCTIVMVDQKVCSTPK